MNNGLRISENEMTLSDTSTVVLLSSAADGSLAIALSTWIECWPAETPLNWYPLKPTST